MRDESVTCDGAKEGCEISILRTQIGKSSKGVTGTHIRLVRVIFLLVNSDFSLLGVRKRFSFPFH